MILVLAGVPSGAAEELPGHHRGTDSHRGGVHKNSLEEQEVRGRAEASCADRGPVSQSCSLVKAEEDCTGHQGVKVIE